MCEKELKELREFKEHAEKLHILSGQLRRGKEIITFYNEIFLYDPSETVTEMVMRIYKKYFDYGYIMDPNFPTQLRKVNFNKKEN